LTDETLVISVQKGNVSSYELLISDHQKPLMRMAMSILKNEDDADDVVQETFVKAFFAIRTFRFKSGFRTWLISILLNNVRTMLKRRKNHVPFDENLVSSIVDERTTGSAESHSVNELAKTVRQEAMNLPLHQRTAFMLRVVEEKSISEIATEMCLSEGTVKSHLHRAFTWIRKKHGRMFGSVFGKGGFHG